MTTAIEINESLIKAAGDIPITLRNGPLGRCLGAFAKPVASVAAGLAVSSRKSGSRLKWSKKFKQRTEFQNDSKDHYGHKVFKGGVGVVIGATHHKGNKQQFVMPSKKGDSYDRNLWGKPGSTIVSTSKTGKTYTYVRGVSKNPRKQAGNKNPQRATFPVSERAPVKAFQQTQATAEAAFLEQLNKEMKELRLG
jgi:hypothetical protein